MVFQSVSLNNYIITDVFSFWAATYDYFYTLLKTFKGVGYTIDSSFISIKSLMSDKGGNMYTIWI